MSLKSRLVLILAVVVTALGLLTYLILHAVVSRGFIALERREAVQDLQRCFEALTNEVRHMDSMCHDWAAWDDTYDFVAGSRPEYVEANLLLDTFTNIPIDFLFFYDTEGKLVGGKAYDLKTEEEISIPELSADALRRGGLLPPAGAGEERREQTATGVYLTSRGPAIVSARPILTSDNRGPARGTVVMGRLLTDEYARALSDQIRVPFRVWRTDDPAMPDPERAALGRLAGGQSNDIQRRDAETLHIHGTYPDVAGAPALFVHAEVPRDATRLGTGVFRLALGLLLLGSLVIWAVLYLSISRLVLRPLTATIGSVAEVAASRDLSMRLPEGPEGELGRLPQAVNRMLSALENAVAEKRRVEAQVLQAQKLESLNVMAGGIAHNFNNALQVILGHQDWALHRLPQAEPVRRSIEAANEAALKASELSTLMLTYSGSVVEEPGPVVLSDLVGELQPLLEASLAEGVELRIEASATTPPVLANRAQLQQVIVNVTTNAAEAIGEDSGTITLETGSAELTEADLAGLYFQDDLPAGAYVYVEVRDTGSGMDTGTLANIFDPYFTTKFPGRGLGLAAVAGIVRTHRGGILVRSTPGSGTAFRTLWPTAPAPPSDEAAG